jgi:hypothetical protein
VTILAPPGTDPELVADMARKLAANAHLLHDGDETCTWCQKSGELQSFGGLLFCDEECAENFAVEWGEDD